MSQTQPKRAGWSRQSSSSYTTRRPRANCLCCGVLLLDVKQVHKHVQANAALFGPIWNPLLFSMTVVMCYNHTAGVDFNTTVGHVGKHNLPFLLISGKITTRMNASDMFFPCYFPVLLKLIKKFYPCILVSVSVRVFIFMKCNTFGRISI